MRDWNAFWAAGDIPWDKGAAAPPLLDLLSREEGRFLKDARILVPGCGSGHDVRALAAHGARPVGLDLSPKAVEVAREAGKGDGETYEVGDFLDGSRSGYDAIWEHTCFCAIQPEQRRAYALASAAAIRPGGWFCGVFYLTPNHDGEGPPFGCETGEIHAHFDRWFEFVTEEVPSRSFAGREGREWLVMAQRRSEGVAPEPSAD